SLRSDHNHILPYPIPILNTGALWRFAHDKKTAGPSGPAAYRKSSFYFLGSTISLMAVLSSPSIIISVKAGIQISSIPDGATNPRAIATALTAWFKAPAPIACISATPLSLITPASAPAMEFGFDFAEIFKTSMKINPLLHTILYVTH